VLDNCEHVIGVAAALAERVVSEAPQAHILATSREALRAEGEQVHLLYSLDCPPEDAALTAMEALRYSAAQLFMERAAASGYCAALSDLDAPIVARICRRLDGVALAIELAASRVGSLGIRGTAELLDDGFDLLWHGRRTALPRHETLNAMLDWSYSLRFRSLRGWLQATTPSSSSPTTIPSITWRSPAALASSSTPATPAPAPARWGHIVKA
jgi:predicted ATPase